MFSNKIKRKSTQNYNNDANCYIKQDFVLPVFFFSGYIVGLVGGFVFCGVWYGIFFA